MIQRAFRAATAAFLLLCAASILAATSASADVVKTRDGLWWPKKIQGDMKGASAPSDELLKKSGRNNLELEYDRVKISGQAFSAAEVVEVYSTTAFENASYRDGDLAGQSRAWSEAADSFAAAAEELKGAGKQIAMWQRVITLAASNDATTTFSAAQQLLEAFPKAYYFAKIQEIRARILLNGGKRSQAEAALDLVIAAPGMNARDYFEAKIAKATLFKLKTAGTDPKKIEAARMEFERIAKEIKGRTGAAKEANVQLLKADVPEGRCHVYKAEFDEALPHFRRVVADDSSLEDRGLLAQAYTGLGDVIYAKIKAELAGGNVTEKQLPRINESLTQAALHYLRVTKFYVESAGDDLFPATVGLARVWATQFTINGEKDCPQAKRAAQYFFEAHKLLRRGEQRRLLTTEVKSFLAKRKSACEVPPPAKDGKKKK